MNILFTICGRAGSKGIKNKNIRDFLGYKLPLYTLSAIDLYMRRNPEYDCDIAVNSDSEELLNILSAKSAVHKIKRSADLAGDTVPKMAVINDCLVRVQSNNHKKYEMIIDLDITSPLRIVSDIERLVQKKLETDCDVVYSVVEARRNPYFNMVKKVERGYEKVCPSDFTARQQAPAIFDMNASMYAYKPEFLESGKGVLDGYGEIIVMYDTGVLDLDHEHDFELMEVIAKYLFEKFPEFGEVRENIRRILSDNTC